MRCLGSVERDSRMGENGDPSAGTATEGWFMATIKITALAYTCSATCTKQIDELVIHWPDQA